MNHEEIEEQLEILTQKTLIYGEVLKKIEVLLRKIVKDFYGQDVDYII